MILTARPVLKYDCNGIYIKKYPSVYAAAKCVSVSRSAICKAIRREQKAGGYYWKYFEQGHKLKIVIRRKCGKIVKIYKNGNYILEALNLVEASKVTGVPLSTIRTHLDKSKLTKSDYTFEGAK